jgi:EAL domain-containing protein (putative c-di-GMP-specific phosphodiesterase class I)
MARVFQELGVLVIAEGVEVPEERDALIEAGCDYLQGYLFARPARGFPHVQF